tara:strand:- start:281 stop:1033 length:753 start_codon:yes stop_codon:yes gene_type:complete
MMINSIKQHAFKAILGVVLMLAMGCSKSDFNQAEVQQLDSVALVSFYIDRNHEQDSEVHLSELKNLKKAATKLAGIAAPEGQELTFYNQLYTQVSSLIQEKTNINFTSANSILQNDTYQSMSKTLVGREFSPVSLRRVKLDSESAIQLCEALNVDAVASYKFQYLSRTKKNMLGGEKTLYALRGVLQVFNRSGLKVVDLAFKSESILAEKSMSLGVVHFGGTIDTFYDDIKTSFLEQLEQVLGELTSQGS